MSLDINSRALSDMLALDSGNTAVLMLIDLSAVFDSVDHDTLLQRLHISYDLGGSVLAWFTSYLSSLIVLSMSHL